MDLEQNQKSLSSEKKVVRQSSELPIPLPPCRLGPEPTLISRKQIDALYLIVHTLSNVLDTIGVQYIITGGTLLGAVRQHSILFCDDDVDIAILLTSNNNALTMTAEGDSEKSATDAATAQLQQIRTRLRDALAGSDFVYTINAWEGSDRVRYKPISNVFCDIFAIRCYRTEKELIDVIGWKKNGQRQSETYIRTVLSAIETASCSINPSKTTESTVSSLVYPCWHFVTRKAIELWPKEVYKSYELFPICNSYKLGPCTSICGPNMPITLLHRAFGYDCFLVFYRSISHSSSATTNNDTTNHHHQQKTDHQELVPLVDGGGTWEHGIKEKLQDEHYIPIQPILRHRRRPTWHDRYQLQQYLQQQIQHETDMMKDSNSVATNKIQKISDFAAIASATSKDCCTKNQNQTNGNSTSSNTTDCSIDIPEYGVIPISPSLQSEEHRVYYRRETEHSRRPRRTVYMDGVFDLFHVGHAKAIQQCADLGDCVIIGVTGDVDATGYKRAPVLSQQQRCDVIAALQHVDIVICPCPLVVTKEFMSYHSIDLVVHGFVNDADEQRQAAFFAHPMQSGKFQRIGYYKHLCTTSIISKIIKQEMQAEKLQQERGTSSQPNSEMDLITEEIHRQQHHQERRFGVAMEVATNGTSCIEWDPLPLYLRTVMEPHIEKARRNRSKALEYVRTQCHKVVDDIVFDELVMSVGRLEMGYDYDTNQHPLRSILLSCTNIPTGIDLEQIHLHPADGGLKVRLMQQLTINYQSFQDAFHDYVLSVGAEHVAAALLSIPKFTINTERVKAMSTIDSVSCDDSMNTFYYQAFPCIRVVQPGEFSIGPHADVSYSYHNPCSVNVYIPLTKLRGTATLFVESRPGSEDWHPIIGEYGTATCFAGASCIHWTMHNTMDYTRVSLDFRMIRGDHYHAISNEPSRICGDKNITSTGGYYCCCQKSNGTWLRVKTKADNTKPDARFGYPWTVKKWSN